MPGDPILLYPESRVSVTVTATVPTRLSADQGCFVNETLLNRDHVLDRNELDSWRLPWVVAETGGRRASLGEDRRPP